MARFTPKLVNDPTAVADELFDGLVAATNGRCYKVGARGLALRDIPDGKVALLVGGGAGHEPIYHGLVGTNLADGAACGDIFAAPSPDIVQSAAMAVDRGAGVLFLYGNYAGDVMNFDLAAEALRAGGVEVETVLIADDVASAPPDRKADRRGIAGLIPIVKLVGAASQTAGSLGDLAGLARRACLQTRSIGAAMAPGSIPATGKPTFELAAGMIGLGMGIHGEAGVRDIPMTTADQLTPMMLDLLFADYAADREVAELRAGDEVLFFVNSLGATTMMECLICYRRAAEYLAARDIRIFDAIVGPLVTCQEMAGMSFSITRVDPELKALWNLPCQSIGFSKMAGPGELGGDAGVPSAERRSATTRAANRGPAAAEPDDLGGLGWSTEGLSPAETRAMLIAVAEAVIAAEPVLTDADRALGDGDHGIGMQRGFRAVLDAIAATGPGDLRGLFGTCGDALLTTMGGASGVVFAALFLAGGAILGEATCFGSRELARILDRALRDVRRRGGAGPGDKTMIDALHPAAAAAREAVDAPLRDAIAAAADAARAGVEATKGMVATVGRAKIYGERSLGLPDPGAISVSVIFDAMRRAVEAGTGPR